MSDTCILRASGNVKFRADRHFLISEVNAALVKRCGRKMTVPEFKELVRNSEPAFTTRTGNESKAPLMEVNVYDINDFIVSINKGAPSELPPGQENQSEQRY